MNYRSALALATMTLLASAAFVPLKTSRSTLVDGSIPETVPMSSYCQNGHAVNGAGTSGHVTPQFATQRSSIENPVGLLSRAQTRRDVFYAAE